MKKTMTFICLIIVMLIIASCSNGINSTAPSVDSGINDGEDVLSMPVDVSSEDYSIDTRGVFGAWKVHVDIDNLSAEILPARNANAIGDIFDADLSQFLTVSPCANCLQIPHIQFDTFDDLVIDISMRHPFENIVARPDLHGFDTRAIIIMETDLTMTYTDIDITMPDGSTEDAELGFLYAGIINADGFTSHYDELVTDDRYFMNGIEQVGNLNPFFRFFEDPTTGTFDPHSPSGYNVMPVGSPVETRSAVFDINMYADGAEFYFYIVADVAYGQSATYLNRDNPQYYLPWFNRTEAWRVEYWLENNVLTNSATSTVDLVVQVFDWQHGADVDTEYPDPANPDGIPQTSDVIQVELTIQQYQDDLLIGSYESGTGTSLDPLQYRFTITNVNESFGDAVGLLAIRDTLNGQSYPDGRMAIPVNPAGFPYETLDIRDYSLYQYVHINNPGSMYIMMDETPMYDNEIFVKDRSQFAFEYGGTSDVTMMVTHHMDPGHTQFTYDWDYNYDGVTFDVQATGMPSPVIPYANPGRHDIGCRVTTNSVPPQEYTYTIPVYAEGEIFNNDLFASGTLEYATSIMRGRSAYVHDDGFYLTYLRNEAGQVDIYLAVGDKVGNVTHHRITNTIENSYAPSLAIIDEGTEAGVYIAYSENSSGGNIYIYATHGNLDGSGFVPGNIHRVTASISTWELFPNLINLHDILHVYFQDFHIMTSYIHGAHSDNGADTWVTDGWLVDNSSTSQMLPSACLNKSRNYVHLVWSDYLDMATRGSDLWYSGASDGITFSTQKNISTLRGGVDESYAEVIDNRSDVFIAYVAGNVHAPGTTIYLKVYDPGRDFAVDYPVDEPNISGEMHSYPSIAVDGDDKIYIAYAQNLTDSDSMYFNVVRVQSYGLMDFYQSFMMTVAPVTVTTNTATQVNPVILTDLPVWLGIDCFVAWTDFSDGIYENIGLTFANITISEHVVHSGNGN